MCSQNIIKIMLIGNNWEIEITLVNLNFSEKFCEWGLGSQCRPLVLLISLRTLGSRLSIQNKVYLQSKIICLLLAFILDARKKCALRPLI